MKTLILIVILTSFYSATQGKINFNTFTKSLQMYSETLKAKQCWICAEIPQDANSGIPLRPIPFTLLEMLNLTNQDWVPRNNSFPKTQPFMRLVHTNVTADVCLQGEGTSNHPFLGKSPCHFIFASRNASEQCFEHFSNETCWTFKKARTKHWVTTWMVPIRTGIYYICGNKAYKWLPENWTGLCYLGHVIPSIRHITTLPDSNIRNVRLKRHINIEKMDVGDDVLAGAAIFPFYGAGKAIWEIRKLAGLLEELSNATFEATEEVTLEMTAMRTMVLQNYIVLDFVLTSKGGTRALIGEEYGIYIPDNEPEISHLKLIEEVAQKTQTEKETWFSWLNGSISSWGGKIMQLTLVILGILGCANLLIVVIKCGIEWVRQQAVQVLTMDQMHQVQDIVRFMKYSEPTKLDNMH
ncbi:syncytin-1-like [Protopterus annectens]|uniref:syncytin-1-like n=1 Tax=Protopterus annectens TaxID=7888 RepID=UPI001CFA83E0|nr:syncytin-1-like [Protopterus annectens]